MKPISLKIKGLNSFIEEQKIDFEKLTDKGLFGIFGPTGSGKSTVLDGITLALYGEVSRKSTNFMNTNCNSLNVEYKFQISTAKVQRYIVSREFKRDKSGSIRSKSAKIVDITNNEIEVLEEGAKSVTNKCKEIIGLELDDFTRTVVLPQGKFSDFLKLEGKERRTMLERLFNLQKYGDNLSNRLINEVRADRQKYNILQGELKGYEDINEEILKEKEEKIQVILDENKKIAKELEEVEEKYNNSNKIWSLQEELKEQNDKYKILKSKEEENNIRELKILKGEAYLKIKPYMDARDETARLYTIENGKLNVIKKHIEEMKKEKENIDSILKKAIERKESELPNLKIKKERIEGAIEETKIIDKLKEETKNLNKEVNEKRRIIENTSIDIEKIEKNIEILINDIKGKEQLVKKLKISDEYRNKVSEGLIISNDYKSLNKQIESLLVQIDDKESIIKINRDKREGLIAKTTELKLALSGLNEKYKGLMEKKIVDPKEILKTQEEISYYRDKWSKYNNLMQDLKENEKLLKDYEKELECIEKERKNVSILVKDLEEKVNKADIENIAQNLREKLTKGCPCPVCGSIEHSLDNLEHIDLEQNSELKDKLKKKQEILKKFDEKAIILKNNIDSYNKIIEQNNFKIEQLGDDFKKISMEEMEKNFELLKEESEKYSKEKISLENGLKELTETLSKKDVEFSKVDTIVSQNIEGLENLKTQVNQLKTQIKPIEFKMIKLKEELDVEEFKEKAKEISENDKRIEVLENSIKNLRENIESSQVEKEKLIKELSILKEYFKEIEIILQEKNKRIDEKELHIKNMVGEISKLLVEKDTINKTILEIENDYINIEKERGIIEEKYNKLNEEFVGVSSNVASLIERGKNDRENLDKALVEEGFKDLDEASVYKISKEQLETIKREFNEYNNNLSKIVGLIENLKDKIGDNELKQEQWEEIKEIRKAKQKELKIIEESVINLKSEIKAIKAKIIELKEILEKKKSLEYKLSLLDDLEKLFKGKRFVEFVATHQLKYISLEASTRLKEITNGNYGLEVDENGKFIIRDYKNGGAQRDASTLSGGETFLVSLSLALALSAQIQLKGTAPLELFFLDEGFGTLDDELLDIVMSSLEKIHNEKLSVGIISHVESIKNRVPVKLILTPAQAGLGGSKVKIERS